MLRSFTAVLLAGLVYPALPSVQSHGAAPSPPTVPVVAGLITVSAVHESGKGDYETLLMVSDVTTDAVVYNVSGNIDDRNVSIRRKVTAQDWAHARQWRPRYNEEDPEVFPGTTGGTLSADVLNDLKTSGQATLKISLADDLLGGLLGTFLSGGSSAGGTLKRVEPQPVPVSMLVNDVRVDLPAVHARGRSGEEPFEVYVLDNPALPLVLRWSVGNSGKRMIRISYPTPKTSHIEEKLAATGRADIYGIYFDFARATIRPESEAVLKEIAGVMVKNPSWALNVEGHTDNIGSAAANQDFSTRRAAAVRQALIDRYHLAPARLAPAGFGASRPKDTNDTLEGRARNRRVELARQPGA